jgi:ABC-type nickel/cobalt efflux system permease component RcnA
VLLGVGIVVGYTGWVKSKQSFVFTEISHSGCGCGHHQNEKNEGNWKTMMIGFAIGLIPCPTALVALSSAITSKDLTRALMVIALFSFGIFIALLTAGMIVIKFGSNLKRNFQMKRLLPHAHWFQAMLLVVTGLWHLTK